MIPESIVHEIRALMQDNPHFHCLTLDARNAFNQVKREAMYTSVLKNLPFLRHLFELGYQRPSPLHVRLNNQLHTLYSREGSRQGDAPSGIFFCAALQPVLQEALRLFPHVHIFAYMDDVTLVGDESAILEAYAFLEERFKEIGLDLNPKKCEVYPPTEWSSAEPQGRVIAHEREVPVVKSAPSGIKVLGAFIARDADSTVQWLATRLPKHEHLFARLRNLAAEDPRASVRILSACCIPRMTYLMRTHPPAQMEPLCSGFDERVDAVLRLILDATPDATAQKIAGLPIRHGGLGVPHTLEQMAEAYQASSSQNGPSQRTAAELRHQATITALKADPTLAALLLAGEKHLSGMWLTAHKHFITATEARIALRLRLNLPSRTATCGCGDAYMDTSFHWHALGCARNTGFTVNSRHNGVRDTIARISRSLSIGVRVEPREFECPDGRHPDLTIYWADCIPWTLDVHVNNPLCSTHLHADDCTARSERSKHGKYKPMVTAAGHEFKAFGLEVLGGWSTNALSWLKKLCTTHPEADRNEVAGEIAVAIQRGNARILLATLARDK